MLHRPAVWSLLSAFFGAFLVVAAPAQRPIEGMTAHTFAVADGGTLPYRLFTPKDAGAEDARWPLVVFLHGAGERGGDNAAQLRHGVAEFTSDASQAARPCFVAAPQCPRGRWWQVDELLGLVGSLLSTPGIDPDRVYLTGLSMGGFATWHAIGQRPDLFAAAVPICGGGKPETAPALVQLPIWAFHGASDRTVKPEQSRAMIEAIRKAGGAPRYTEYEGVGHDSWTRAYGDPRLHEWLFAQRRGAAAIEPLRRGERVVFFGDSITQAGAESGGYIDLLAADLRAQQLEVELIGAGISGNRVPDLLERCERDVLERRPTCVVVYIGINDVWHHANGRGTSKAEFEQGLRTLMASLAATKAKVVLCTPSVIGEKTDGSNEFDAMLDEYAAISRAVATATGTQLLDLRQRFLARLREQNREQAAEGVLTSDGVHLNAAGNRLVADCMRAALGVPPVREPHQDGGK